MKNKNCKIQDSLTKTFFVKVFGCQYNEWDAARICRMLKDFGFVQSGEKEAGIIIVIACSVRKSAVDRLLGKIKNWQKSKKVIVAGCVLDTDKKKLAVKGAFFWDMNKPKDLVGLLGLDDKTDVKKMLDSSTGAIAYLPIMLGCNNFCSYCVVPYTKGRERYRPVEETVKEFQKLIEAGFTEILLLGQNVNSYKYGFARLLKRLNDLHGNFEISFISNHPKDMTIEIIQAVRDLPRVKKEIHLPVQSGSNKILEAMNRPYTKEQYLALIEKIKRNIPNIKITTDAIVGFPGETEKDFEETVEVYKKVNFSQSFTNKYSPREGTAAYKLGDPVPWKEKQRRWKILNDMVNK